MGMITEAKLVEVGDEIALVEKDGSKRLIKSVLPLIQSYMRSLKRQFLRSTA